MKLLEYEAKALLQSTSVPIPHGEVFQASRAPLLALPAVIKSQVPIGGRGKLGGVVTVHTADELKTVSRELFAKTIRGFIPRSLLAEELLAIDKEFYLSFTINRNLSCIELIGHSEGGIEIESHNAADFFRRELPADPPFDAIADELADYFDIADKAFLLEDILRNCFACFTKNDCLLLEINPLILTKQGKLVAGDCKMTVDDAAGFRHTDWRFEETPADANFVTLHETGTVATIANGAGLAMATVDAVQASGLQPANFLDIGGTATTEKILNCFMQITEFSHVNAIIVNIFGGIVRCDVVAQAILDARKEIPGLPHLYIRLTGNRSAEARALLRQHNLPLYDTLADCLGALK